MPKPSTHTARVVLIGRSRSVISSSCVRSPAASRSRSRRRRMRLPTSERIAGVRVTAIRIATRTATAPTVPIRPRKSTPVTFSASSATMTVTPANTTALPEVPFASPIDSCRSAPCFSWRRCRLMMKSE